jgi:hypothetical protein
VAGMKSGDGGLRAYAPALFLASAAATLGGISLLVTATVTGPAALLLTGAAVTKGLDIHQEQRSLRRQAVEQRRTGLDETRRLLYMIRWSPVEPSAELLATVVNALVHHHGRTFPDDELVLRLMKCDRTSTDERKKWVEGLIADITAERDSLS